MARSPLYHNASTLDAVETDPGIPPEEATPEDHPRAATVLDEFAESLAAYAAALARLERYAAEEAQHARDRRRASWFN
jgi:hypothetical protein